MRKKLAVLLLSMSILGLGAGCSGKEETDTENTQNTAQETEEESVVNSEGLVVAVDVDNLEDYVTLGQYQNLTVEEEPKEEVTQEDVDDYVERQLIYNYAPVEVTQDRAVQENEDSTVLVYCRSGNRSKTASSALAELGYTNIYEFGGINTWPYETES